MYNIIKILSNEYIDDRNTLFNLSKAHFIEIFREILRKELLLSKSSIQISINYFSPDLYTPLAREDYLEFNNDNSVNNYTECSIHVKTFDDCLSYFDLNRFLNNLNKNLKKIGFNGSIKILDKARFEFNINCNYYHDYDKLVYTINKMESKRTLSDIKKEYFKVSNKIE
jgi:hypothetical protein